MRSKRVERSTTVAAEATPAGRSSEETMKPAF